MSSSRFTETSFTETYTLTLGDQAENHVGMQKIGKLANAGFTLEDLTRAQDWFLAQGGDCELVDLSTVLPDEIQAQLQSSATAAANPAYILILRKGVDIIGRAATAAAEVEDPNRISISADGMYEEQRVLPKDTKAKMYGRVVNKHARHNLCFSDAAQNPDYENGRGRIVAFTDVPMLAILRQTMADILGPIACNLAVEGNYYFSPAKCGIGYHGDSERMKVIGVRMGASMPLCYAWFQNGRLIHENCTARFLLNHGDMYIMSQKATGQDWKSKKMPTLRHAAGCAKYTTLPDPHAPPKVKRPLKNQNGAAEAEAEAEAEAAPAPAPI